MRHRRVGRSAMPVFLARRTPHDVTRPDILNRAAFALHPAEAGGNDQRLAERMRVPCRARARLEGDLRTGDTRGLGRTEQRIDANGSGEPVGWAFAGGLRAATGDFHNCLHVALCPEPKRSMLAIEAASARVSMKV